MKRTYGVFQVEEVFYSGYLRPGDNQGWNSKSVKGGSSFNYLRPGENKCWNSTRCEEGFHPRYQQQQGNQGWNHYRSEERRSVLSPEEKDQVSGKREQLTHRQAILQSSTMPPNDPKHDDAEGWCKTAMN
ncbi:hypothetical protein H5410_022388 [Solanum commersonii]|uniref:Uncharacterized protein n=1 Tax=Solanum commersonii TaxID=4109 RepID=A0A9J5ZDU3_SOLCO|nr:hypothetical protein H5410_022388 [Solanum commersonii]